MDERFIRRIIANTNVEAFLPQNLSLNLMDFMINDDDNPDSIIVLIHAVTILYKNRFNIDSTISTSDIHGTFLFKSSVKKYILIVAQELDFRVKKIKNPKPYTVDNVLF